MKTISKTEAAKRFGVAPSMVTKYISRGMPVTSTGTINWAAAQRWRKQFISPMRSGSFNARQRKARGTELLREADAGMQVVAGADIGLRDLLDKILSRRHLVAGILADIGLREPVLLHCADDIFAALVLGLASPFDDAAYDWAAGDDIPMATTDIQAVFEKCGLKITADVAAEADTVADQAYAAIRKAVEGAE